MKGKLMRLLYKARLCLAAASFLCCEFSGAEVLTLTPTTPTQVNVFANPSEIDWDKDPSIAADGNGNLVVVWLSQHSLGATVGTDWDVLCARSADGGQTWSPAIALSSFAPVDGNAEDYSPKIATDSAGRWVVVWTTGFDISETGGTSSDLVWSKSEDNGATWTTAAPVYNESSGEDFPDSAFVISNLAAGNAGEMIVTWSGYRNYESGHFSSTFDVESGTWSEPVKLSGDDSNTIPSLATDHSGKWVVVWSSHNNLTGTAGGDTDIYYCRSTDSGATWSAVGLLNTTGIGDTSIDDLYPNVCAGPDGIWLVSWSSGYNLGGTIGTDIDILLSKSLDSGQTWGTPSLLNSNGTTDEDTADLFPVLSYDNQSAWLATWMVDVGAQVVGAFGQHPDIEWAPPTSLIGVEGGFGSSSSVIAKPDGGWQYVWGSSSNIFFATAGLQPVVAEGEGEGISEGNPEGEPPVSYEQLLYVFATADSSGDSSLTLAEVQTVFPGFGQAQFDAADANGDAQLSVAELLQINGGGILSSADTNGDFVISLNELLRGVQLASAGLYACAENAGATEDGFTLGSPPNEPACVLHSLDQNGDKVISLSEFLRLLQFYSSNQYSYCPGSGTEDGFCPDIPALGTIPEISVPLLEMGNGYVPGEEQTITLWLSKSGSGTPSPLALGVLVDIPNDWEVVDGSLTSDSAQEVTALFPTGSDSTPGSVPIVWLAQGNAFGSANNIEVTFTVRVPANAQGGKTITAQAYYRFAGGEQTSTLRTRNVDEDIYAGGFHSADQNEDNSISLSELLRVVQFANTGQYHCEGGAEDGYAPGPGDQNCAGHDSDYGPQDFQISLSELLRALQIFNLGSYFPCEAGEDGFCIGAKAAKGGPAVLDVTLGADGYTPGSTTEVTVTIDRTDGGSEPDSDVTALGLELTLPSGWKLARDAGDDCRVYLVERQGGAALNPGVNASANVLRGNQTYADPPANTTCVALPVQGNVLELFWMPESNGSGTPLPINFPVELTLTLDVSQNSSGTKTLAGTVKYRVLEGGEQIGTGGVNVEEGGGNQVHSADLDADFVISEEEYLRVVQFFDAGGFRCDSGSEDGYAPNSGDQTCAPHSSDYAPQDWVISESELLRLQQLRDAGGYYPCAESEDGFCLNGAEGEGEGTIEGEGEGGTEGEPSTYTFTSSVVGNGTVSPTSGSTYEPGTPIVVSATPGLNWTFDRWEGSLTGTTNPAALVMNGNRSVTAVFRPSGPRILSGTVTNSITGNPVEGAYVEVSAAIKALAFDTTDATGAFEFTVPENTGAVTVTVTRREYLPQTLEFASPPVSPIEVSLVPVGVTTPATPVAYSGPRTVFVEWEANPEYNLKGYYVWRTPTNATGTPTGVATKVSTLLDATEYQDTDTAPGAYYSYQVQALSGGDRPSTLSPVSEAVKAQFLTVFIPDVNVNSAVENLYLWDLTPEIVEDSKWVRVPISARSAYEISSSAIDIVAELPNALLDVSPGADIRVETTGITDGMSIAANVPTTGELRISAADQTARSLFGSGVLFDVYLPKRNTANCAPMTLLEDTFNGQTGRQGVRLYDDGNPPVAIPLELENGTLCTTGGPCLHGDVNNDGVIDELDVRRILAIKVGQFALDECSAWAGDINLDQRVDSADALMLDRWLSGLPINPPSGKSGRTMPSFAANASDKTLGDPVVWVGAAEGNSGAVITVPLYVRNGASFSGFSATVNYLAGIEGLTFQSAALGDSLDAFELRTVNSTEGDYGSLELAAAGAEPLGTNATTELVVLTFQIGASAPAGQRVPLSIAAFEGSDAFGLTPRHGAPGQAQVIADASEGSGLAELLMSDYFGYDTDVDGLLDADEAAASGIKQEAFDALDVNDDGKLQVSELLAATGGLGAIHRADQSGDGKVNLSELLRVIQLYNSQGYHCAEDAGATEDGYLPGTNVGAQDCIPHASDYVTQDWNMNLSELLRLIQFYNIGGYELCEGGEDDFCPQS